MSIKDKIDETLQKLGVTKQSPNTPDESKYLVEIQTGQTKAEASKDKVEVEWDDEYKMVTGDQWSTTIAYRSRKSRRLRPNSVDNFILPAVINIHASLTANTPETVIETGDDGDENDTALAEKLTHVSASIKDKNKFPALWKKLTMDFLQHGPVIGAVLWDPDWTGGNGPNRWIGEVRLLQIKRKEFFPDPAILDLEERLQDCGYINRKMRRKLAYFRDRWEAKGYLVDTDEDTEDEEGQEHGQATLIEHWHRGKPKWIPEDFKKECLQKAKEAELKVMDQPPDPYRAQMFKDMAEGKIDGIHVANVTASVFLDYKPYIYDDGLYPFVYKVLYLDEKSPWGFGEVKNVIIPQLMHNKADEIEIEAMSKEGLGGFYYNKGALSPQQLAGYETTNAKGGAALEVNDINGMKDRTGAKVPASVSNYKDHKQRMIETISQNTPIQQGLKPGGVTAYGAIAELGARSDTRTKGKAEILEDFLTDIELLIISRVGQFYQESRTIAYRNNDNKMVNDRFSNRDMQKTWEREAGTTDEQGQEIPARMESYVPDFYPRVKVMDERPTNRKYYEDMGFNLFKAQIFDAEDLLYTLDEGKFPPKEKILAKLEQAKEMAAQQAQSQSMQQPMPQAQPPPQDTQAVFNQLPPQVQQMVAQLPQDQAEAFLSQPIEQIAQMVQQMIQGAGGGQPMTSMGQ